MIEIDEKLFKECINDIASSDSGKVFFAYLKNTLGWDDTIINLDNNSNRTIYEQSRRGVYGGLRKLIHDDHLKEIEFNYKLKAVENDRSSNTKRTTRGNRGRSTTSTV